jgi:TonB family protein
MDHDIAGPFPCGGFGKMIRLLFAERGFAFALIVSAAIHVVLLPVLLSLASGSAPVNVQPIEVSCIKAFLVQGTLDTAVKREGLPGRKRRETDRAAPVAAAPLRKVPGSVTSVEKEGNNLLAERTAMVTAFLPRKVPDPVASVEIEVHKILADIRSPAEWLGSVHDTGALPASASPALAVLFPGGVDRSGSNSARIPAALRGDGEFSGEYGGALASRREGTGETPQERSGAWPTKDADAVPRYGDKARPVYPPLARLRGYQGVVVLFVEVLVDGRVGQVKIRRSTGHEILDRAALETVRTWSFEPGRREGRAVTMSVEVPVRFVLNGNSNS